MATHALKLFRKSQCLPKQSTTTQPHTSCIESVLYRYVITEAVLSYWTCAVCARTQSLAKINWSLTYTHTPARCLSVAKTWKHGIFLDCIIREKCVCCPAPLVNLPTHRHIILFGWLKPDRTLYTRTIRMNEMKWSMLICHREFCQNKIKSKLLIDIAAILSWFVLGPQWGVSDLFRMVVRKR